MISLRVHIQCKHHDATLSDHIMGIIASCLDLLYCVLMQMCLSIKDWLNWGIVCLVLPVLFVPVSQTQRKRMVEGSGGSVLAAARRWLRDAGRGVGRRRRHHHRGSDHRRPSTSGRSSPSSRQTRRHTTLTFGATSTEISVSDKRHRTTSVWRTKLNNRRQKSSLHDRAGSI